MMPDVHPADVFCLAHNTYAVACCGGTAPTPDDRRGCGQMPGPAQVFRPRGTKAVLREIDRLMRLREGA